MKTLIFDFDGTLTDFSNDWKHVQEIINNLLVRHNVKPLSAENFEAMRDLSLWRMVRSANLPVHKLPFIVRQLKVELAKQLPIPNPYPRIQDVLSQLHRQGSLLGIVTSNTQTVIDTFLREQKLDTVFSFSYASPNLFGKHKIIKKAIYEQGLNPDRIWYIGDEIRDIKAARKANIRIASVTWGLNSRQSLVENGPDKIVETPSDLLTLED